MRKFIGLLSVLIILLSCANEDPYKGKYLDVSFDNVITFGQRDSLPEGSLFSVEGVQVGPDKKIYVADGAQLKIKVYSQEGEFLYEFGKRGRGPSEFTSIKGFSLIDTTLYAWDQSSQKLSLFSLNGELKDTFSLQGISAPIDIFSLKESYLILHGANSSRKIIQTNLAHIYTKSFDKRNADFLSLQHIIEGIGKEAARYLRVNPGSIYIQDDNTLLFIPYIYNGNIYKYVKISSDKWQKAHTYKGLNQQKAVSMIEKDYFRQPDASRSSVFLDEKQRFIFHKQSRGFLKFKDYYFHFTFCDIADERVFGVEIYDTKMNPIGYKGIKSIPITNKENNFLQWFVDDVDKNGNFYIRERNSEGSQIRVLKVNEEDLEALSD